MCLLCVCAYPEYNSQRNYKGESGGKQSKDRASNSTYDQNELSNPCNYSSSIYYGGQEVYSPNTPTKNSHHAVSDDNQYLPVHMYNHCHAEPDLILCDCVWSD